MQAVAHATSRGDALHRWLHGIGRALAKPRFFCALLIWLMVLLVVGTIAQRYIGLYQAWQKYFASFFFWEGVVPLPGGYAVLSALAVALVMRLLFATAWRNRNQAGITIVHLGALLLLSGTAVTALFSSEGNMVIREGESSSVVHDYYDVEFVLHKQLASDVVARDDNVVLNDAHPHAVLSAEQLGAGTVLTSSSLPFAIEVLSFCHNCTVVPYKNATTNSATKAGAQLKSRTKRRGFASKFALQPLPLAKEPAENVGGIVFRVLSTEATGIYAVYEAMPVVQKLRVAGTTYTATVRRRQTVLPFRLHLVDFVRENHPGSDVAKRYRSEVLLMEDSIKTRKVISMNEPLRHRGFTFYQASFIVPTEVAEDGADDELASEAGEVAPPPVPVETTVLAVVQNSGRLFPYFSSIFMCFGLLLHLAQRIPRLIGKNT